MKPEVLAHDLGGVEVQYLHYPGDGPAVAMLHATGFQPWLWHPIARELAADGHRVIAPYFCEHRIHDPLRGGLSWQVLAGDLAGLIEGLEVDRPTLVGHSMGAVVSTIAEALHGPLASRLILIEPIFLPSPFYEAEITVDMHPMASRAIRRRNRWEGEEEAREYFGEKELFRNWDREVLELYFEYGLSDTEDGALTLACHPEREAALFMGGTVIDPWTILDTVTCPVLLLEGGTSENHAIVDLARAASTFPRAELRVVEGAGHLIPMEKPRETLALIREFLSRS